MKISVDQNNELVFVSNEDAHHAARVLSAALDLLDQVGESVLENRALITLSPELIVEILNKLDNDSPPNAEDVELLVPKLKELSPETQQPKISDLPDLKTKTEIERLEAEQEGSATPELEFGYTKRQTEDKDIIKRMSDGDEVAQAEFVARYHKLIVKTVREVMRSIGDSGIVTEEDLYQEAFEHILIYAPKFKHDKGASFSTYFMTHLRVYLATKYINLRHQVRSPDKIRSWVKKATKENERRRYIPGVPLLNNAELMELFGTSNESDIADYYRYLRLTRFLGSIDSGFNPGQDTSLGDEYPEASLGAHYAWADPRAEDMSVEETYNLIELREIMTKIFDTLGGREELVIKMYYGFNDSKPNNYIEIGKTLGVTPERVRQIHKKAMEKLRHPSRSRNLKPYTLYQPPDNE